MHLIELDLTGNHDKSRWGRGYGQKSSQTLQFQYRASFTTKPLEEVTNHYGFLSLRGKSISTQLSRRLTSFLNIIMQTNISQKLAHGAGRLHKSYREQ